MTNKTTDELKDIAREVARELVRAEVAVQIDSAVERSMTKWLDRSNIVTEGQVENLVAKRVEPLEQKMQDVLSIFDTVRQIDLRLNSFLERATRIDQALARLEGMMPFISRIPDDMERIDSKTENNRNDITILQQDVKTALVGEARLRMDVLGDPTAKVDLSFAGHMTRLLQEMEREARTRHEALLGEMHKLTGVVTDVKAQVQRNTTFIENRRKIEQGAVKFVQYGGQAVQLAWKYRWFVAGGAVSGVLGGGLMAYLFDPQFQAAVRAWLENLP